MRHQYDIKLMSRQVAMMSAPLERHTERRDRQVVLVHSERRQRLRERRAPVAEEPCDALPRLEPRELVARAEVAAETEREMARGPVSVDPAARVACPEVGAA